MFCAIRIVVYASHPYIMHCFDTSGQTLRTTMTEETTALIFTHDTTTTMGTLTNHSYPHFSRFFYGFFLLLLGSMDIQTRFSSSKKWENHNALSLENKEILIASYFPTLRFNRHVPNSDSLLLWCPNLEEPTRMLPNHSKPYPNGSSNGSTVVLNRASTRSLPL